MLYFAYGSNMSTPRLRQRAPSARPLGTATLRGHVLRFHKRGRDGSAKCDAVHTGASGDAVHGVLFDIEVPRDWEALDRAEGGYDRTEVEVEAATMAGEPQRSTRAVAYRARAASIDASLLPFAWYLDLVVAGAREHGLPRDYIAAIARQPTHAGEPPA